MTDYPQDLDGLRWEKDDGKKAGYLIFDRPPMNTISFKGRSQIAPIIHAMDNDPDVRVIVIRGANGLYSSGGDIAGFLKVERDGMHDLHWSVAAPERAKKPVIAAIEKWAMGVSFELSLACDFRLATENSMLALPEINLGVTPGSGGTVRVAHLAGLTRAKEMIMRGRRITARANSGRITHPRSSSAAARQESDGRRPKTPQATGPAAAPCRSQSRLPRCRLSRRLLFRHAGRHAGPRWAR